MTKIQPCNARHNNKLMRVMFKNTGTIQSRQWVKRHDPSKIVTHGPNAYYGTIYKAETDTNVSLIHSMITIHSSVRL